MATTVMQCTFNLFITGDRLVMKEDCQKHSEASTTKFLNYLLNDLMPWHKDPGLRDFSLLEANWCIMLHM